MTSNNHLSAYLKLINPSEIEIKEDSIFYRDKYKEIIEYLKLMLTDSQKLEIYNYFKPKGLLLINISPGTDLLDYLKLISSNFYVKLIQLRESEIRKDPSDFVANFITLLRNVDKLVIDKIPAQKASKEEKEEKKETKDYSQKKRKLFIIEQKQEYDELFEDNNLFMRFLTHFQDEKYLDELLDNHFILIWINYNYQELLNYYGELFNIFDLFINIPRINEIERRELLRKFMEQNPGIVYELDTIVRKTEQWEVQEIKHLLTMAILKHYLTSELTTSSNEITDTILGIIENGEYIPYIKKEALRGKTSGMGRERAQIEDHTPVSDSSDSVNITTREIESGSELHLKELIEEIKGKNYSKFMQDQLYENAASENYNELVIIIDKLNKHEPLEDNDRKILADYPFILNDTPSRAQLNLEKAKKRIDLIKKSFGK